jgi:FkbM family methyltransferase
MFFASIRDHTLVKHLIRPDSVVIDLGANKGDFSMIMVRDFGCRCFAIEALPTLFGQIPEHPLLTKLNVAVAGMSGTVTFHANENPEAGTITRPAPKGHRESITINSLSLPDLLARLQLRHADILKMDVEGAEIEALAACSDSLLQEFQQITIEFHDFCGHCTRESVEQAAARLQKLGFWVHRYSTSSWSDTLFVNRRRICAPWFFFRLYLGRLSTLLNRS